MRNEVIGALLVVALATAGGCGKTPAERRADESRASQERERRVKDEVRGAIASKLRMDAATRKALEVEIFGEWARAHDAERMEWRLCRKRGAWAIVESGTPGTRRPMGSTDESTSEREKDCDRGRPFGIDVY